MRARTRGPAAAALGAALVALGLWLVPLAQARGLAETFPNAPLQNSGRWITDDNGRVVILHGLNIVYKRPPYQPAAIGFGGDDARFLAENGFNTIRLGLIYKRVEPRPGSYRRAYIDRS